MKKFILLLIFVFCAAFLSSCYDKSEVEETAYMIALGIDLDENNEYLYTFQFASPLSSYSESGGDAPSGGVKNISVSAKDFYSAKNSAINYLSKSINMSHLKLIVCSKEFAEKSVKEHIGLFMKEREIRPSTFVAVSEDKAKSFLDAVQPEFESSTSKYYELSNSEKMLIFAPFVRLSDFLNASETFDKSAILPVGEIIDKENSKIKPALKTATQLSKMAVFKDYSLLKILPEDDARIYNLLSGKEKKLLFSFENEKNQNKTISYDVLLLKSPRFKVEEENNNLKISVEILTEIKYVGEKLPEGYNNIEEVLSLCEKQLEKRIYNFLKMTQSDLNADILKLKRFYKFKFKDEDSLKKADFEKKYKNAGFQVKISPENFYQSNISNEIN